jgi:hypothetical protein
VASLTKDPTVASLRPAFAAPTGAAPVATPALTGPTGPASIDYVQVYTPFMWGKVGEGGLTVAITLTDSSGTKVLGVPVQTTETPPSTVQIDRTSLYFETVFVNPANTKENVIITPGDQVTVVTSLSGVPEDTRNIPVYDVHAYTNYTTNSVSGSTTAPPAQWPSVYVTSGPLSLNDYLTTTSNLDFAQTTIGADGSFAVSSSDFVTPVTFKQGSTGFVRVERSDGSEIYTVHGQNNFVLENSNVMHGYAYDLPTAPSGLQTGVTVVRPAPTVTAILENGQGSQLSQGTATPIIQPWSVAFGQTISAGDIVTVSINGSPPVTINVPTLTGQINLAANEITGTGPANSTLTLGVGQIDGYVSKYSYFYYYQSTPTTNASGSFSVGSVSCGTNQSVSFKPGSFAYVGYYDGNGNMIYLDFAAPRTDVMANFNYLDGWIADGTDNPTVTVKNSNGAVLEETTTGPTLL